MTIDADVLMITYNRPEYTAMSLGRLLETCPPGCRVWLWHNGTDERTLKIVEDFASHPGVAEFRHSEQNKMLREPTNWFWENATGELIGKVDDDCLVPAGWVERMAEIHAQEPNAGVLSCWPFPIEDYKPQIAAKKIVTLGGDHQLLRNAWVGGGGYLMKRAAIRANGLLIEGDTFSGWCLRLANKGWLNGWPVPLLIMDEMDHPASPYSMIRSEADFQGRKPLSAKRFGISSLEEYRDHLRRMAWEVQTASPQAWRYLGWPGKLSRVVMRLRGRFKPARFDA